MSILYEIDTEILIILWCVRGSMKGFTRMVSTANEYRAFVNAADTLGLEIEGHHAFGAWESEGETAWPGSCKVKKVGYKYFHIKLYHPEKEEHEIFKCLPQDNAQMEIHFIPEEIA